MINNNNILDLCGSCAAMSHPNHRNNTTSIAIRLEHHDHGAQHLIKSALWELPCKHPICFDCFENQEKHEWIICEVCNICSHIPTGVHYYFHLERQASSRSNQPNVGILKFQMRLRIKSKA